MNAINKALQEVHFQTPHEVLNICYVENNQVLNQAATIDERLMTTVIRPRVLVDCNLVGGVETKVALNRANITNLSTFEFLVNIPKDQTAGRSIISVLSLVSNVVYNQALGFNETPAALSASMNMMNNLGVENVVQTSRLELISDNTVLVADPTIHLINGVLRCVIENSPNMENINPRAYPAFSKLVVLAVKAYIYNTMIVKLNKGYIYGGHELGVIKDIIDNYADAEEQYQEHLNLVWKKISFINDDEKMGSYVRSMVSNTI